MTGLAADPICKEHVTGPQHPEQPARFGERQQCQTRGTVQGKGARKQLDSRRAVMLAHALDQTPGRRSDTSTLRIIKLRGRYQWGYTLAFVCAP